MQNNKTLFKGTSMKKLLLASFLLLSSLSATEEQPSESPNNSIVSIHDGNYTNGTIENGTSISTQQIQAGMLAEEATGVQKKAALPTEANRGFFAFVYSLFF